MTASFGVAFKGELLCPEELIAAADEALYRSKRAGKNRVSPGLPGEEAKPARRVAERRKTTPKKAPAKKTPATGNS